MLVGNLLAKFSPVRFVEVDKAILNGKTVVYCVRDNTTKTIAFVRVNDNRLQCRYVRLKKNYRDNSSSYEWSSWSSVKHINQFLDSFKKLERAAFDVLPEGMETDVKDGNFFNFLSFSMDRLDKVKKVAKKKGS